MPTYDYRCDTNQQVIEVRHSMAITLKNWGELAELAGLDLGDTPSEVPVHKLANGGQVVTSGVLKNTIPPCQMGGGCGDCGG
jgi:hypothetical protein